MILMIHGAGATSLSFNYISLWLDQEIQTIDYKVGESKEDIFKRIHNPEDITYIMGHSYGGLLSAMWLDENPDNNAKGLITIASPWQGSPTARILNWFLSDPVWHDMNPGSDLLKAVNQIQLNLPVKNIVANPQQGGNGLAGRSTNDGTIPVDSARNTPKGFTRCRSVEIPHGHSEILQSWSTIEQIRMFIDDPVGDTVSESNLRVAQANIKPGYVADKKPTKKPFVRGY